MGNPVKREPRSRRAKKREAEPQAPPPPLLFFRRGCVWEPECKTFDVVVTVPLQHLQNRAGVYDAVLRSVLHRPHPPPSFSTLASSTQDTTAVPLRSLVHVEHIDIQTDSARQANHAGDVRLRATIRGVLARIEHGLLVGVAKSTTYTDTMVVQLQSERDHRRTFPTEDGNNNNNNNINANNNTENVKKNALLVTARCLQSEPVAVGHTVLLVSEPGTLRCLAIRPPRRAPVAFELSVENGEAVIRTERQVKEVEENTHATGVVREPEGQKCDDHSVD